MIGKNLSIDIGVGSWQYLLEEGQDLNGPSVASKTTHWMSRI